MYKGNENSIFIFMFFEKERARVRGRETDSHEGREGERSGAHPMQALCSPEVRLELIN